MSVKSVKRLENGAIPLPEGSIIEPPVVEVVEYKAGEGQTVFTLTVSEETGETLHIEMELIPGASYQTAFAALGLAHEYIDAAITQVKRDYAAARAKAGGEGGTPSTPTTH